MDIKDYIMIGIGILGVCTGIAGLIFGIYQHRKNQQLEKEKLELERSKEKKHELKEKIVEEKGKKKKRAK